MNILHEMGSSLAPPEYFSGGIDLSTAHFGSLQRGIDPGITYLLFPSGVGSPPSPTEYTSRHAVFPQCAELHFHDPLRWCFHFFVFVGYLLAH